MNLTLPQQLYMVSHSAEKSRLDLRNSPVRGMLFRAAALAELSTLGLLADQQAKAVRNTDTPPPEDPFLGDVLSCVPPGETRLWVGAVHKDCTKAESFVRGQLTAAGRITPGRGGVLGMQQQVTFSDPEEPRKLRERVRNPVLRAADPAEVPLEDAMMTVLLAEGGVGAVFTWQERREYRTALKALAARFDAAAPGVRKAFAVAKAMRSTG
ncbi:GPP34 family phosphoprotein [Streptomyces sp. NPDC048172]|uniref:GOLPH3/VPS74 family protein n=1 Tax=Streptomyces sp. NPDC048172 TaxID=3365505 RepID=UPI003720AB55